jgi:hypothetical protein
MLKRFLVPVLYLVFAVYIWIDFLRLPPDGLANVGLLIATLPVTVLGLMLSWAVGSAQFVLMPGGFGYYANHAIYYWPSVLITATLLYGLVVGVRHLMRSN